jgi:SAM-dependent methyltransferase
MAKFGVKNYDDYWKARKATGKTKFTLTHGRIVELIRQYVDRGGKILDCGVGPAQSYKLLAPDYEMYGVEISPEAIALYDFDATRIRQANLNEGVPDFGVRFDGVIASMIIHHLEDPLNFLNQARDRLAPNGIFLAVHPNISYYKFRLDYLFKGSFLPISSAHRIFLPPHEFRALLESANLEIIETTSSKSKLRARRWPHLFSQDLFCLCRIRKKSQGSP